MKAFLILFLTGASMFAADTGVQVVSMVMTNGNAVFTMEVFTRNGETNLVRRTLTRDAIVQSRTHEFYQSGMLVGEHWAMPDGSGFITEAHSPYSMILKIWPSNNVTTACICTEDRIVIDYFTATNGVFYPVDTSAVQAARKMTTEMHQTASPATQ